MKLLSYASPTGASFGIVDGRGIVDLKNRLDYPDLITALRDDGLPRIEKVSSGVPIDYMLDDVVNLPAIPNPNKIICVGLNYLEHRLEGNHDPAPAAPALFVRFPESQVGHLRPLVCPLESDRFDFEAELAVVIGKAGRRIAEADALSHVAGISCYNDASVRDWQLAASQWTPGKNFRGTGAFGPWIVTTDELLPDRPLSLICRLNGVEMQRATTDMMIFSIAKLISHISSFTSLGAGDVIVTGTPGGVGHRRDPQIWMKHGDVVEVELEGVGVLRNPVVKEGSGL